MSLGKNIGGDFIYYFSEEKLHDQSMVNHHILVKIEYPILDILLWIITVDIRESLK